MLDSQSATEARKNLGVGHVTPRLIGYILTTKNYDPGKEAILRLQDKCERSSFRLDGSEWDIGYTINPYRVGLWRALRKLVCVECEPRRLPFSLVNFSDFMQQALKPCMCGKARGLDGIVVSRLDHITSDTQKGAMLILELAQKGKHVVAEDGICLSCCHPATKSLLGRA